MQREIPQGSQFFSMEAAKELDLEVNEELLRYLKEGKDAGMNKEYDTTSNTHIMPEKTQIKYEYIPNCKVDDSCFEDFQDFIKRMPKQNQQPSANISISSQFSLTKEKRIEITPSYLKQKEKYVAQSNWLNDLQLRCIIDYNNKKVKTVCRIKDAQMQFENGGCAFRLTKITKIKVLFQNYQKCICFTYDQVRGKKILQLKFKIFVENDLKDDLYVLFSKVILQKLMLLDYSVDLKAKDDPNADKFMMTGEVYKLSQVMHQWKVRKLVLTDRIESFKGQKCTFQMKNIKQMWTRFQIHQKCLVVKLRHGKQKTELALPIVNYTARFCANNWLYRIYRLLTSAV